MDVDAKVLPETSHEMIGKSHWRDPLNKGLSPFGIGLLKHIESVTLANEFLVKQNIDVESIDSNLLAERCFVHLISGPGWTNAERKEGLSTWLQELEVGPKEVIKNQEGYFNWNLARAVLMCYNAVDAVRDVGSDSRLARMIFQGQMQSGALV